MKTALKIYKNHIVKLIPLLIPAAWFILFRKTIAWIFNAYFLYENVFGIVVLLGIIAIIMVKAKRSGKKLTDILIFEPRRIPLTIVLMSVAAYLTAEYYIGLNILLSVIFGIGTYGLAGLYLDEKTWKQGFLPAILIILTLPFGTNLDTYLGFPLRMFTTDVVTNILSSSGIENLQTETIVIIENRAANIDLPCSGMKGLWSGTLFFLFAVWIERRKINLYTIFLFLTLISLLVGFNIARITTLVLIDTVYNLPELAEIIHLPAGIIGFVFSLLIVWLLLRLKNQHPKHIYQPDILPVGQANISSRKLSIFKQKNFAFMIILIVLISANFLHFEKGLKKFTHSELLYIFPGSFDTQEIPLSENEQNFLISNENDRAKKIRFNNDTISGSVLISTTSNWRGHHKPELCFSSEGLKQDFTKTIMLENDFHVKEINFSGKEQVACYWFQSGNITKSDFSARIWDALLGKHTEWTMISVLFDKHYEEVLKADLLKMLKYNTVKGV